MLDKLNRKLDLTVKKISSLKGVYAIFLFGSNVNGKPREDSDIDIAVLTKGITREQEMNILGYSDENIDLSIFSNLPLVIQFRVLREGKLLFLKNPEELRNVKLRVFRDYLDYSPFINNFYRRVIQNV